MKTKIAWSLCFTLGCASDYSVHRLPDPDPAHVEEVQPNTHGACPDFWGDEPPYHCSASAIEEPIGHCSDGTISLGLGAYAVNAYHVEAVAFLINLDDPDDPGEHWTLDPSNNATFDGGASIVGTYWSHIAPVGTPSSPYSSGWSSYACDDLTEGSSLTYAYAILDEDGSVLDCVLAGAAPDALRRDAERAPHFPVDDCRDTTFAMAWAREPDEG